MLNVIISHVNVRGLYNFAREMPENVKCQPYSSFTIATIESAVWYALWYETDVNK